MHTLKEAIPETNRILVTDDDPDELFATSRILTNAGFTVSQASSGEEAIEKARCFGPDLMLVDVVMPHVDGYEVCRRIRAEKQFEEISVILLSSFSNTPHHKAKGLDNGADDFISRPFDAREFLSRIRSILRIKTMEKQLRLQQECEKELGRAIFNWTALLKSVGQIALVVDPAHRILDANDVALERIGLSRKSIIGKKCFELLHGESAPPDDCPMTSAILEQEQRSSETSLSSIEGDYITTCTPIIDENGKIEKLIHISTDISELKRIQKDLEQSEQRYCMLFKASSDPVLVVKKISKGIVDANEAASTLYGYSRRELVSLHMKDLSVSACDTRAAPLAQHTRGLSRVYHRKKDGTVFPVEMTTSSFEMDGQENTIIAIRDISFRIAAEEQKREMEKHLRRSQKLESLGTLAGGIAHDFNNILSSIIGFTELSFLDVKEGKSVTGNLNEIYSAGLRAVELVRQILTFARQAPHHVEPVKIGTIVKEVCKFLGSSLPSTIEITRDISPHAHVMADPTHIHQLLMNLCTNSAHAMEENGGKLDIVLSMTHLEVDSLSTVANVRRGDYVALMVSDTGKGIPAHLYEKIFDPYFTTKPPEEGTGLGLATAHGIVEQCRGYITVDSQKGVGTCFRIYLPAAQKDGVVPVEEDSVPCGTEHILFVDDEPSILKFGSLLLKNIGYQVTTRGSSVDALDLFRAHPDRFGLVITDMTMPVMTGDILAREIKKISPEIPIILCTGYSKKISMETADSLGVDALAFKPMVKGKLAQIIRRLLDNAK